MELSGLAGKRWIVSLFINKWVGCVLVSVSVPTASSQTDFGSSLPPSLHTLVRDAKIHLWGLIVCFMFQKNKWLHILFLQVSLWLKFRERTHNISWNAAQVQGVHRLCLYKCMWHCFAMRNIKEKYTVQDHINNISGRLPSCALTVMHLGQLYDAHFCPIY